MVGFRRTHHSSDLCLCIGALGASCLLGAYAERSRKLVVSNQHPARLKGATQEVSAELHKIMSSAYRDVWKIVWRERVTFREAAFLLGVGQVYHAGKLRGGVCEIVSRHYYTKNHLASRTRLDWPEGCFRWVYALQFVGQVVAHRT